MTSFSGSSVQTSPESLGAASTDSRLRAAMWPRMAMAELLLGGASVPEAASPNTAISLLARYCRLVFFQNDCSVAGLAFLRLDRGLALFVVGVAWLASDRSLVGLEEPPPPSQVFFLGEVFLGESEVSEVVFFRGEGSPRLDRPHLRVMIEPLWSERVDVTGAVLPSISSSPRNLGRVVGRVTQAASTPRE